MERRREKATVVLEILSYSALINNFKRNHGNQKKYFFNSVSFVILRIY